MSGVGSAFWADLLTGLLARPNVSPASLGDLQSGRHRGRETAR